MPIKKAKKLTLFFRFFYIETITEKRENPVKSIKNSVQGFFIEKTLIPFFYLTKQSQNIIISIKKDLVYLLFTPKNPKTPLVYFLFTRFFLQNDKKHRPLRHNN